MFTLVKTDLHTTKFTQEHINKLLADMESHHFLWPDELQLFTHTLIKNEAVVTFYDEH
jgi:hypothetical protein